MSDTREDRRRGVSKTAALLILMVLQTLLASVLPAQGAYDSPGVFVEGADKVELASDSSFANPTALFDPGDTVYVRVTTPRVPRDYQGNLVFKDLSDETVGPSGGWIEESSTSPYVYVGNLTIPDSGDEQLQVSGHITDGPAHFQFQETIDVQGSEPRFHMFRDPAYSIEANAFTPGSNVYLRLRGTGAPYSPAHTGSSSQRLQDFAQNTVTTWDEIDISVLQRSDVYDYAVTLPNVELIDSWWYGLQVRLADVSGNTIVDQRLMLEIAETPPQTVIIAPTGGRRLGGTHQLITGSSTNDVAIVSTGVSIVRDADGFFWEGSTATWTADPVWNEAVITAGQGSRAATWQYGWTLPAENSADYSIHAKAVDESGIEDPAPASVSVTVANIGFGAGDLIINGGAGRATTPAITLGSDAINATDMRFAEATASLESAEYVAYDPVHGFDLTGADGTKTVFGQYRDLGLVETTHIIFDQIYLDTVAPVVGTVSPPGGALDVAQEATIVVFFNEENQLAEGSISGDNFYLEDAGGSRVPATLSYDAVTKIVELTPASILAHGQSYTVYVTGGIADTAGNSLTNPMSWVFTTDNLEAVGPYTEGEDRLEVARDSVFASLIHELQAGSKVYVRVTTPRVTSAVIGALELYTYDGTVLETAPWTQVSTSTPYVYLAETTIPPTQSDYLRLRASIDDGSDRFEAGQTIDLVGVEQRFETHREAESLGHRYAFRPGDTVHVAVDGTGDSYSAAATGPGSQRLNDYANADITTWDAPTVGQDGDVYSFSLTLPAQGLTDGWWYDMGVTLKESEGASIVDQTRPILIDEFAPETTILNPTGGAFSGENKLLTGIATDTSEIEAVSVGIHRAVDDKWWTGMGWDVDPTYVEAQILSGHKGPVATWQYVWVQPTDDGGDYTVYAKAVDTAGREDPLPAIVEVSVDNIRPTIDRFVISDDATYTNSTLATLDISVAGASSMRFAQTLGELGAAVYEPFSTTATKSLSSDDGLQKVFAQFRDAAGNQTVAGSTVSMDSIIVDTKAPTVKAVSPLQAETAASTSATIAVEFTEANEIDPSSIVNDGTRANSTFYLMSGADWTTASVSYDPGHKRASLTPDAPMDQGVIYTAHLTPGLQDRAANSLDSTFTWGFAIADQTPPDTEISDPLSGPLTGSSKTVLGSAEDNAGVSAVTVAISRDIDGRYWDETTWAVEPVWNPATILAGQDSTSAIWQYVWRLPDDNGGDYTILARAADRAANRDESPPGVTVGVDNTLPIINELLINDDATYSNTTSVTIENSVTGASQMRFAETPAGLSEAVYETYRTAPSFALSVGDGGKTIYSQYRDIAGNETSPGAPHSMDSIDVDTVAPVVGSVDPFEAEAGVPTATTITVDFSEANEIDMSTIVNDGTEEGSSFYLMAGSNWTTASVSYDPAGKRASLRPAGILSQGTSYTVYLTTDLQDRAGNALSLPHSSSFGVGGSLLHPPARPIALDVVAGDLANVLIWDPVSPAADAGADFDPPARGGYNIYRSSARTGPWVRVNSESVTASTYEDPVSRSTSSIYFYKVKAVDEAGTEGGASDIDDNGEVSMSKSTSTLATVVLESANGNVSLSVPSQTSPTTVTISTPSTYPGGVDPVTLVYEFEPSGTTLDPSATVTFVTPGDPTGMLISVNSGSGWQVLGDGNYSYNVASRTISYTAVDHFSHYTVTESTLTAPHGTYLASTTFCEVCHDLHSEGAGGSQRGSRLLRAEEDNTTTAYTGSWAVATGGQRSSGASLVSSTVGDTADVQFVGKRIGLRATETPASGRARIYIDGVARAEIDLYRASTGYQALSFEEAGLTNAEHTMTVEVLGTKNASSTGFAVDIDAYDITKPKDMGLAADDEKELCYICHDGTGSAFDIAAQFGETSGTPVPTSSHPVASGVMLCSDCHSPHAMGEDWDAVHDSNEAVRLLRSDYGVYLGYVVVESNTWLDTPQPANLVFGIPEERKFAKPYEMCGACHGEGSTLESGNILANFDYGGTKHDSTATVPAGTKASIACTSCHEWHVSDLPKLLEPTISGSPITGNNNSVCYACHIEAKIVAYSESSSTGDIHGAFESTQTTASPGLWSPYNYRYPQLRCDACHDPHGSGNLLWIRTTVNGKSSISIESTDAADWADMENFCTACHAASHNPNTQCTSCHFHGANADETTTTRF